MNEQDRARLIWRKSSFSGPPHKNCVEVAGAGAGAVSVRDSKDPSGPVLAFTRDEWIAFLRGVRAGEFD